MKAFFERYEFPATIALIATCIGFFVVLAQVLEGR
jgi:hypothetical protein